MDGLIYATSIAMPGSARRKVPVPVLARWLHWPRQALALLERLHTAAAAQARTGSVIEIQALQALALAATAKRPRPCAR